MKKVSKILVGSSIVLLAVLSLTSLKEKKTIEKKNAVTIVKTEEQDVQGLYVLKTCENSRFKIKIEKKSGILSFSILDGKKTISKGKVKKQVIDNVTYLTFGKIEGMYEKNKIQVQNYGNSMNEYEHFTQCEEKYLAFIKS
jgi:hypothetical protein